MSRGPAAVVLLILGVAVAAGLMGASPSASARPSAPGTAAAASSRATTGDDGDLLERGRALYLAECASCHGQELRGSQRGPSLLDAGAASVDFQLRTGRMPLEDEDAVPSRSEPHFAPPQIDALVAYVGAVGEGPPVPTVSRGDLDLGRQLYLLNCASCHSATGSGYAQVGGRRAPALTAADPVEVAEAVRVGPGMMPRFPEDVIDQHELDSVVTYVQALQEEGGRGGASLGRIGPVTETLVGFAALVLVVAVVRRLGKATGS